MNDDQDEDVIFENSPLYKHLLNSGMEHIQPESISHVTKIKPKSTSIPVDYASLFIDILGKFYQSIVFYLSKTKWGTENLEAWYHMTTLKHVHNSKALEEDDSAFLENYINCNKGDIILTEPSVYDCFKKWNGPINYLSTGFLVYTLIWCTGIFPMNLRPMADLLAVAFGVCVVITCFDVCFYWWKRRIFMDTASGIEKCIKTSEKVLHLSRHSLRLIQETELVARGFTLVSHRVAVSGLEQQSSINSSKLCSELRKTLFYVARSGMLTFREATLKLLDLHPLIPEVDSVCNYLASVPLSDYGPCLQQIGQHTDNDHHLAQLTDSFSVAALRGMNQLFSLYLSEFIRRLTLCFIQDAQIQGSPAPFDKLGCLMEELFIKLDKEQNKLRKSYDFHRSSPLNREPTKPKFNQQKTKTGHFYTAVHSLDLHLQSALIRTQELSMKLEKQLETEENTDQDTLDSESKDSWHQIMKEVKGEIEACKGCWEEGVGRLNKSQNKEKQIPKLDVDTVLDRKKEKEINIVDVGEYIIEDQVFEGYTDVDNCEDSTWDWEPILSPEEKEKKQREKEEAKRLLTELRSVISVRAVDRERREKVAIEKARGTSVRTTVANENSHTEDHCMLTYDILTSKKNSKIDEISAYASEVSSKLILECTKPDSDLSSSDIFSSTKAELSTFKPEQVSNFDVSPILSEADQTDDDFNHTKPDLKENLNNSALGPNNTLDDIGDTFASVSALDEQTNHKEVKVNELDYSTECFSKSPTSLNKSNSEYSTTSSQNTSCLSNSVELNSSSDSEDLMPKLNNSSKSSSGFFEGKDQIKPTVTSPKVLDETYSVESQTQNLGNTQEPSSLNSNSLQDVSNLSSSQETHNLNANDTQSKPILSCESYNTPQADINKDVSSFFTPASSFTAEISGVVPLVDSITETSHQSKKLDSMIKCDHNVNYTSSQNTPNSQPSQTKFTEYFSDESNTSHMALKTSFQDEKFDVEESHLCDKHVSHGVCIDTAEAAMSKTSESELCVQDNSIIETNSECFLEQSIGFNVPPEQAKKSSNSTYETGSQNPKEKDTQNIQEQTFEHDPADDPTEAESLELSDKSLDITSPDTSSSSTGEPGQTDLDIRISRLPGANLAFTASIAAMAAARSVNLNLNIDTFGDSSSDGDDVCECSCDENCDE